MFQVKMLEQSVTGDPIEVGDNFGQGWVFECRGTNTRRFKALKNPQTAISTKYSANLLAEHSPEAIRECEAAGKRFVAAFEDSDETAIDVKELTQGMSDEARSLYSAQITSQAEQSQKLAESEPPSVKGVASLIKGWHGLTDEDGLVVTFSFENAIELLSSTIPVPSGEYEGDEIGEALRRWIPSEIIRITSERENEVASNAKNSLSEPSGGSGSTTDPEENKSE